MDVVNKSSAQKLLDRRNPSPDPNVSPDAKNFAGHHPLQLYLSVA
jgi:hypothetical protein